MKNILLTLALLTLAISAYTQLPIRNSTGNSGTITVTITGLDSDEGQLMVALYNSSDSWLKEGIRGGQTVISDGTASVTFENVPFGTYAISSFHDENSNDKLDTGLFGIPKEPYASSRGAKGVFGPPKWKDAQFELKANQTTEAVKF